MVRFCLLLFPLLVLFNRGYTKHQLLKFTSGLAYISISLALLVNLRSGWIWGTSNQENSITTLLSGLNGFITTVLLVFAIWINDTMAYLIGSMIGKTPLTSWSPKKTWEGTVGGILVSVTLMFLVGKLTWGANWELLVILLATAIFGTIGDLVESKFKRMAGVKDSGNFMPGHGGFLDRFDSILLAAPAVWAMCYLMYR